MGVKFQMNDLILLISLAFQNNKKNDKITKTAPEVRGSKGRSGRYVAHTSRVVGQFPVSMATTFWELESYEK